MTATQEIIAALVAGGMDTIEAASLVARAAVEMTAIPASKSAAAQRQQRYRDRNKASQSVTSVTRNEVTENVTKRNESVTTLRTEETPISYLLPSLVSREDIQEKKESKKERKTQKRNAPLPDGWHPSLRSLQIAEEHGQNVQLVEQIFRDYLKSSGKLYADYDAAFNNFIRNQRKFNGNVSHGSTQVRSGGSIIAAIDRQLAEIEEADRIDSALPEGPVLSISDGSVR